MSTSLFEVTEHIIQCQYIREYPHAQKIDQRPLKLAIKEYRPLKNLGAAAAGSVTLIATHANGLAKVCMKWCQAGIIHTEWPQAHRFERKRMSLYGMIYTTNLAVNLGPFGLQTAPTKALAEC